MEHLHPHKRHSNSDEKRNSTSNGKVTDDGEYERAAYAVQNGDYSALDKKETDAETSSTGSVVRLKKNLGLVSGTAMIAGTMIGSGIFVSPRGVLVGAGSVGMSLVVWATCGILAMFGALCYAELGTAIPQSGGEHAYFMYTFRKCPKGIRAIPAFLFDWLAVFIIRPSMVAIMSLSLGTYATKPFYGDCDPPPLVMKLVTIAAMLLIAFINCFNVKAAAKMQTVLTASKLIAAAVIIGGGCYSLAKGNTETLLEGFEDTQKSPDVLALSFYNGLWAYDGWNNLNFVTEELRNPGRNLPGAIMIAIPLTTIVYILINVGYFAVLTKEEILMSDATAVLWAERMLGVMAWIIPVFVVLSCFGAGNGSLFSSARLVYAASRDSHLPHVLSFIHVKRCTPVPSVIFTITIAILLILPSDLGRLISIFSFTIWMFFLLSAVCLLRLRFQEKDLKREYIVPIFVPVMVILAALYLIFAPIIINPQTELIYVILFMILGLIVYIPMIYMRLTVPFTDRVSVFLQKILMIVAPT